MQKTDIMLTIITQNTTEPWGKFLSQYLDKFIEFSFWDMPLDYIAIGILGIPSTIFAYWLLLSGRLRILEEAIGWLWGRASFLYGVFPFNIICGVLALAGLLMPAYVCIFMAVWTVAHIRYNIDGWIQHGPYLLLGFAIIGAVLYGLYALFRFIFRKLRAAK